MYDIYLPFVLRTMVDKARDVGNDNKNVVLPVPVVVDWFVFVCQRLWYPYAFIHVVRVPYPKSHPC